MKQEDKVIVLGDRTYPDGRTESVKLKVNALTTHAVIVGSSGTGKTGALMGIAEELIENKIPIFMIDCKSDLANIVLQGQEMREKMAVRLLTPGGSHGESVNIFSGIANPDRITSTVTALCKMIGAEHDPLKSRPHAFLANIIQWRLNRKLSVTIQDVLNAIVDPPFQYLGMLPLDEVLPKASRGKLAARLNNLLAAPGFQNWREGTAIDIPKLLTCSPTKAPVIIYSVAHLVDDGERIFAISMFLEEVLSWMRTLPGTKNLEACLILDEMYGVMPPHPANPPTKRPLLTMIKQGRAHGLGVIICSQNPMDLDYKGMSNAQTWLVGRLTTVNDRTRVVGGICASSSADERALESSIARLQPRQFLCVRPTANVIFHTRDCKAELRGPMSPSEIKELFRLGFAQEVLTLEKLQLKLEEARAVFEHTNNDENWKAVENAQKEVDECIKAAYSRADK